MALNRTVLALGRILRNGMGGRRTLLSDAYGCREAWEERLLTPALRDINMDEYFTQLEKKFNSKKPVDGVDVDIFANCVCRDDQLDELEHFTYRFRRSRYGIGIFDSTHHAFIRAFMQFHRVDDLLKILFDRINYGIFPDFYCYNMLMDYLLSRKNYRDATKVAVLVMLQEDFSHPITNRLALHSCHTYLREPLPELWTLPPPPTKEEAGEEEEEEVFVRIPFQINPYFDNHFDVRDPEILIGKTLVSIGRKLGGAVGTSYQLVGFGMCQRWKEAGRLLDDVVSRKVCLAIDGVEMFRSVAEKFFRDTDSDRPKELDCLRAKLDLCRTETRYLHDMVGEMVGEVSLFERDDVDAQTGLFKLWAEKRESALESQLQRYQNVEKLRLIENKKRELSEKEKLLFFFENWNKIEMELEEVKKMPNVVQEVENDVPPEV